MKSLFQGASGSTIKFLTKRMLEEIQVYIPTKNIKLYFNMCVFVDIYVSLFLQYVHTYLYNECDYIGYSQCK